MIKENDDALAAADGDMLVERLWRHGRLRQARRVLALLNVREGNAMKYTTEQMWRDLQAPALIVGLLVVGWSLVTAFEAAVTGQSFWACVLRCSY